MARFFIDRPVFAMVLAILITLLGLIAGFSLPIAQYPNITKPRISVSTNYTGASAETVEESVAQAIEQKVNGVENMLDMSSTSTATGEYSLNVQFNLEKDADIRRRYCCGRGTEPCIPGYQLHAAGSNCLWYYHHQGIGGNDYVFRAVFP